MLRRARERKAAEDAMQQNLAAVVIQAPNLGCSTPHRLEMGEKISRHRQKAEFPARIAPYDHGCLSEVC
jgi:hypothetical protein